MAELTTFGSVMTFAIQLEAQFASYYAGLGNSSRAADADKRRTKLERIRREHVVEITLEPIDGLFEESYRFDWDNAASQQHNEQAAAAFYRDAAPKINVKPAARALERAGEEHAALA